MSTAELLVRVTPEEYLAAERRALDKHEYLDGEIWPMPGVSRAHSLIATNLIRRCADRLDGRPCEVHGSDLRVRVDRRGLYTYPDVSIVCGEARFADAEVDTLLNPTVLIEVLSDSTEAYDRGRKFQQYQRLDSLREYVLVAQDRIGVERFARRDDGWLVTGVLTEPGDVLRLESIDCAVPLAEIYARVELPPTVDVPQEETTTR